MSNVCGMTDIQVKIFNEDWNTAELKINEFLDEYNGRIIDVKFENGVSGGVKVMVVYRKTA